MVNYFAASGARPNDGIGGQVRNAFMQGRAMRQEQDTRNALSAYAQDPDNPENFTALAQHAPQFAMKERSRMEAARKQEYMSGLLGRFAQGDETVLPEIAQADPDLWMKLGKQQQESIKQATSIMANASLAVGKLPPEQRSAAWAQYVRQAEAGGIDIPQELEVYSEAALNSSLARAGMMEKFIKQFEPDWRVIPEGGVIVDTNNQQALSQFNQPAPQSGPSGGPPPENPNPQSGITEATEDQIARVTKAFGGDTRKAEEWMRRNNVVLAKEVNGQKYYKVNGQWFDNPEGR